MCNHCVLINAVSRTYPNTSRGHQCILSRKYFPITLVDREKSENHNDIYFMAFALKGTVLKIVKEKVISNCGRRNALSRAVLHELVY